jgi:peptidoglycan/xylan/chitin deacetylase (PgdA/CDA1 family)
MRNGEEIADLLEAFSRCLGVEQSKFEESLSTVTSTDLALAANAGVDLENHGWTHLNPQTLSERELAEDVTLNESYLSRFRQARDRVFAPPFGRWVAVNSGVASYLLLADRSYVSSKRNRGVVNRFDLHVSTLIRSSLTNFRPMVESVQAATE